MGDESLADNINTTLSFYSRNTHTIFRPYLELKYDDSVHYEEGTPIGNKHFSLEIDNFQEDYSLSDSVDMRLNVIPTYPTRQYQTSSIYRANYILPETSYWGIKDEYTNQMIVNFDTLGTKISSDEEGNFFHIDMGSLEPERYYRLLVQVEQGQNKFIVDNRNIFRVKRNGKYQ